MSKYTDYINSTLQPHITEAVKVIDLFAGCGGLSLGFEAAGFETIGYEMIPAAVDTYNQNLKGVCNLSKLELGFSYPQADIVIGGPPCQPFSVRGKQQGMQDARDGFPIFIDAIRRINPRIFMFENVRNLAYSHKWYLNLILDSLRELGYLVEFCCLNAVDYGVPQNRERIFVIGHKSIFRFPPKETVRVTVGEAIGETMNKAFADSHFLTPAQDKYIAEYEKKSACINPRDLYPDRPARTITCRNLAGATSDMQRVKLPDGRRRRISSREAARLQSFPDWFEFSGNEVQQFTQIGNAVPPLLAYKLALAVKDAYHNTIRQYPEIEYINKYQEQTLFDSICV